MTIEAESPLMKRAMPRQETAGFRLPTLHRYSDLLTAWLIYCALIFGPWAFGTTQEWSIAVMNGVGIALGFLWLGKLGLRWASGWHPIRWDTLSGRADSYPAARRFTRLLGAATLLVLLYCFISAVNARATYLSELVRFEYHVVVPWLPHSFDRDSSWAFFWKSLALAGLFWALRDWLLTLPPEEAAALETDAPRQPGDFRLPLRLRRLFWVLAVNGALLATQGLIQRVEGSNRLLWLIEPRVNKSPEMQFGAYAYRGNAAQYFNLLWPAVLGFWSAESRSARARRSRWSDSSRHGLRLLLPGVLLMALCPVVSTSRGGAMVLAINLVLAAAVLWLAHRHRHWESNFAILVLSGIVLVGGGLLGWKALEPRLAMLQEGWEGRQEYNRVGLAMAADNPVFGTGPGTLGTMYQLYRRSSADLWPAKLHNDWLETLITFGWLGTVPIFAALLLVLVRWFFPGGIQGEKQFVMLLWIALVGCLIHACFDFPLQIHSILTLFVVLCAVLSCLSRQPLRFP